MLARWFERGLGNIVAPDENFPPENYSEEGNGGFWQMVAPDPSYEEMLKKNTSEISTAADEPPSAAFSSPGFKVPQTQCDHCKKMTPVRSSPPPASRRGLPQAGFHTPSPPGNYLPTGTSTDSRLNDLVLSAAKATAVTFASPPGVNDKGNAVLRLCSNAKPLADSISQKLKKYLTIDESVRKARATNLGHQCPDGLTPLMAAAYSGNVGAAKLVLDADNTAHIDRDLQGRTALHIAGEYGNVEVAEALLKHHEKDGQPFDSLLDLVGRTPFGTCLTSPNPKAKKNRSRMEQILFSPTDLSILGSPPPAMTRQMVYPFLDMAYGTAEMPGYRVYMEDALSTASWQNDAGQNFCLLGVCDGHGDQGKISKYVADNIPLLIQAKTMQLKPNDDGLLNWQELWADSCLEVDANLKGTGMMGGSTAVFALITRNEIVVANVGDSRCILVQKHISTTDNDREATGTAETPDLVNEEDPVSHEAVATANGEPSKEGETHAGSSSSLAAEDTPSSKNAASETEQGEVKSEDSGLAHGTTVYDVAIPPEHPKLLDGDQKDEGFTVVAMSEDHKPNLEQEKARIERAGLTVVAETFEENGQTITIHKVEKSQSNRMAVSRSFGDFEYKANKELGPHEQAVTAVPDVRVHSRNAEADMFLVLACDGIWDVMTSHSVGKFIVEGAEQANEGSMRGLIPQIGDDLLKDCLQCGSRDNMTVSIAALSKTMEKFPGGAIQGKALSFSP